MNLLNLLPETYSLAALVQNMYADILVYQLRDQMTAHLGPETGSLVGSPFYNHYFPNDAIYGAKIYDQFLFDPKEKPGSLFLSIPVDFHRQLGKAKIANQMLETYPEGLPYIDGAETYFTIEGVMQNAAKLLRSLPAPFFAYLHFMPPHAPYRPNSDYLGQFDDGWAPKLKKHHPLATRRSTEHLNRQRQDYDEYIANLDAQFGELLDGMDKSGMLDNSYLIVTSDHGDLFERGSQGHVTPLLFEAITHIPLLISTPGQRERRDIHHLTSNVDLLPTLLKIVRKTIPESCEGRILPGLGDNSLGDRTIFSVEAKKNPAHQKLKKATVAMWQGQYKLIQYMGYKGYRGYEFYDLENDPDELIDLFETHPEAQIMKAEMERQLEQTDKAYL
jgi:arylsulfatase A-like enzyme